MRSFFMQYVNRHGIENGVSSKTGQYPFSIEQFMCVCTTFWDDEQRTEESKKDRDE